MNQTHCEADSAAGVCHVEVTASGRSYKASGAVQGGVPVLLELCGNVFRQPVCLAGSLLFFKAPASPQLLSSVAGKNVMQSPSGAELKINPESRIEAKSQINQTHLSHHRCILTCLHAYRHDNKRENHILYSFCNNTVF